MGLFTEYLKLSYKQSKPKKPEDKTKAEDDKVDKAKTHTEMAQDIPLMTFDGQCPNGGVPPGALYVFVQDADDHPPNMGIPPEMPAAVAVPQHQTNHICNHVLQQCVCAAPREPLSIHYHNHYHNHAGSSGIQPPTPPSETHIRFITAGIRPFNMPPDVYYNPNNSTLYTMSKATTIRKLLEDLGCPTFAGHGVQQVFPVGRRLWEAGQIFKWGDGDQGQTLGSTELGKGEEGHEVWLCSWTD